MTTFGLRAFVALEDSCTKGCVRAGCVRAGKLV